MSFPFNIFDVALSPNNRHVAFVGTTDIWSNQGLYQWNLMGNKEPRLLTNDTYGLGQMIDFTPDSKQVLIVDPNLCIVAYDVQSGDKLNTFSTLKGANYSQSEIYPRHFMHRISPDGARIAITSPKGPGVDVWDWKSRQLLYSLPGREGYIYYFAWSPDSQRLAVSRSSEDIEIWNLAEVERNLTELALYPSSRHD
jgi:WD40 repeat protein